MRISRFQTRAHISPEHESVIADSHVCEHMQCGVRVCTFTCTGTCLGLSGENIPRLKGNSPEMRARRLRSLDKEYSRIKQRPQRGWGWVCVCVCVVLSGVRKCFSHPAKRCVHLHEICDEVKKRSDGVSSIPRANIFRGIFRPRRWPEILLFTFRRRYFDEISAPTVCLRNLLYRLVYDASFHNTLIVYASNWNFALGRYLCT